MILSMDLQAKGPTEKKKKNYSEKTKQLEKRLNWTILNEKYRNKNLKAIIKLMLRKLC